MRRRVWSRNLVNEEALARVEPQRHKILILITLCNFQIKTLHDEKHLMYYIQNNVSFFIVSLFKDMLYVGQCMKFWW